MKIVVPLLAALLTAVPGGAAATTVSFTYAGVSDDTPFITSTGSGTISFDGAGALALADLTGFSLAQTTVLSDPSLPGSATFSYGLGDLLGFGGVFGNGAFSSLTLRTRTVADPSGFLADEAFQIRSLRTDGASTSFDSRGSDQATTGTVQVTAAVPEPASWGLTILGIGLVGVAARRRRPLSPRPAIA